MDDAKLDRYWKPMMFDGEVASFGEIAATGDVVVVINPMYATLVICGSGNLNYTIPAGSVFELCPVHGCANAEFVYTGSQLFFHPDNLAFIQSNTKTWEHPTDCYVT